MLAVNAHGPRQVLSGFYSNICGHDLPRSEGVLMQVSLEAIKFNLGLHDQGIGALPIRRNETESVTLPEWRRGDCSTPDCAPAAYVRSCPQTPLIVEARFSSTDLNDEEVEIRAVAPDGDVLGNLEKAVVRFDGQGQSQFVPFTIPKPRFSEVGVSASTTKWEWQILEGGNWLRFEDTSHRIYCILARPTEPWVENLPWTEVLEVACEWAKGAQDLDLAAAAITQELFDKGTDQVLGYHRSCTYANEKFNCTGFLALLKDKGVSKPQKINCDDCATIVSTFANILGCDLWQSGMSGPIFTNSIVMIGAKEMTRPTFPRHAVAWKNKCEVKDQLFDGCLAFGPDGRSGSREPDLPRNLVFFESRNMKSYKSRLMSAGFCEPNPKDERHRRPLGQSYFGSRRFTSTEFLTFLKEQYHFEKWGKDSSDKTESDVIPKLQTLLFSQAAFSGLHVTSEMTITEKSDLEFVSESFLEPPELHPQRLIGVNLYRCGTRPNSSDFLLQLLGQFHTTDLEAIDPPIGDVAFQEPGGTATVFKREPFVVCVRSLGKQDLPTTNLASAINLSLMMLTSST